MASRAARYATLICSAAVQCCSNLASRSQGCQANSGSSQANALGYMVVLTQRWHAPLQRSGVWEPGGSQRVAPVARVGHHTQERTQAAWRRRRAAKQSGWGILNSTRA